MCPTTPYSSTNVFFYTHDDVFGCCFKYDMSRNIVAKKSANAVLFALQVSLFR